MPEVKSHLEWMLSNGFVSWQQPPTPQGSAQVPSEWIEAFFRVWEARRGRHVNRTSKGDCGGHGSGRSRLFFLIYFFLLKDNCFTEFCCFLSNLNMSQPQVYIKSPPFWTSLPSPFPSHPSRLIQSPCLSFPSHTANSTGNGKCNIPCYSVHTLCSPLPMSISLFSMSVSPLLPCK